MPSLVRTTVPGFPALQLVPFEHLPVAGRVGAVLAGELRRFARWPDCLEPQVFSKEEACSQR